MYIGPWQEYKLASVIKMKNDLFEGSLRPAPKLTEQVLTQHNERTFTTDSNSTEKTFISENVQRRYPRFNVDTYYKQWRHIEEVLTRSEATQLTRKKPMVPQCSSRKRQPKSLQAQRVNKMRQVYGLAEKEEFKLPSIEKTSKKITEEKAKEYVKLPLIHKRFEENEEDQVDGLLKWVEELPEEISVCSSEMSQYRPIL